MAISDADIEHVRELFHELEPLTIRRMFGGTGIYSDGRIFAVQRSDGILFLKAKGEFAERLAEAGADPFEMEMKGKLRSMGYMSLPPEALDDPGLACQWARDALRAQEDPNA